MVYADICLYVLTHLQYCLFTFRGHCGYPVTHFWRHVSDIAIFFQVRLVRLKRTVPTYIKMLQKGAQEI